jgi:hypothetical protein
VTARREEEYVRSYRIIVRKAMIVLIERGSTRSPTEKNSLRKN